MLFKFSDFDIIEMSRKTKIQSRAGDALAGLQVPFEPNSRKKSLGRLWKPESEK